LSDASGGCDKEHGRQAHDPELWGREATSHRNRRYMARSVGLALPLLVICPVPSTVVQPLKDVFLTPEVE
jgi:hypothetical protein